MRGTVIANRDIDTYIAKTKYHISEVYNQRLTSDSSDTDKSKKFTIQDTSDTFKNIFNQCLEEN